MTNLTPQQSARILRALLQHVQKALETNPQFTVANLATLMTVIEHAGAENVTQPEIGIALGDPDPAVLSRQLRYLRGKRQGVVQSPLVPVVALSPLETDNRVNVVSLTDEGVQFSRELATLFNRLLKQALKL